MERKRKKSKIQEEIERSFEIDEDSDYPVHERYVKEGDILEAGKKKRKRK